jgi:hypothetical protein
MSHLAAKNEYGGMMAPTGFQWQARAVFQVGGTKGGTVSNAWNFIWAGTGSPTPAQQTTLMQAVRDFYVANVPPGNQLETFFGPQFVSTGNSQLVELYNVDTSDPHHALGSPVNVLPFTTSTLSGGNPMPNECSVVLSLRAAYGTDPEHEGATRPRASDRGRVYLGPFAVASITTTPGISTTQYATVATTLQGTIINNIGRLKDTAAAANWLLAIWSRKEEVFKQATQYSLDNNWDTQRRRSLSAPLLTWTPIP